MGRDALLQTILEDLRKQRQSLTTQHFLVIGPRGTGKTHLTELLARRLAGAGEFPWRTVRLPEEGDFDGLAAVLGKIVERDLGIPRNWDAPMPPVEVSVETLAQRRAETAKPLLVIMENLPTVLARGLRGDQEINHFRALLMNDPSFTLLATAPRYFEEIGRENRPLYDFFRVFILHELKSDEIEELGVVTPV